MHLSPINLAQMILSYSICRGLSCEHFGERIVLLHCKKSEHVTCSVQNIQRSKSVYLVFYYTIFRTLSVPYINTRCSLVVFRRLVSEYICSAVSDTGEQSQKYGRRQSVDGCVIFAQHADCIHVNLQFNSNNMTNICNSWVLFINKIVIRLFLPYYISPNCTMLIYGNRYDIYLFPTCASVSNGTHSVL